MLTLVGGVCFGYSTRPPVLPHGARSRQSTVAMQILLGDGTPARGDDDFGPVPEYVDPLAKPRPQYDLCAASGRPDEIVFGAVAPESAAKMGEWTAHMRDKDLPRMMALFSDAEASTRSPDGAAAGYTDALRAEGFSTVEMIDLQSLGARDLVLASIRAAKAAKERVCVHCADGEAMTSIVMADWLLQDYIGGDNYQEASDALAARKRLGGVGRVADVEALEKFVETGSL